MGNPPTKNETSIIPHVYGRGEDALDQDPIEYILFRRKKENRRKKIILS